MRQVKADAAYLFEHWKQSGENRAFVDMLFQRILKERNLKLSEVSALKNEFRKLIQAQS